MPKSSGAPPGVINTPVGQTNQGVPTSTPWSGLGSQPTPQAPEQRQPYDGGPVLTPATPSGGNGAGTALPGPSAAPSAALSSPGGGSGSPGADAGGGKNSTAAPYDYQAAAGQQETSGQQNVNSQTQTNRPNQNGAFSNQQWTQDANGNWTQTTALNGPLGGAATNLQSQVANQGPLGNGDWARNQAITGAYNQATSRLDPQWAQMQEQQQTQLANQGLDPTSAAAQTAGQNFNLARNDAYSSAMNNAIGQGTAAQQATFGENLAAQNNPYQQMGWLNQLQGQQGFNAAGINAPLQSLSAAGLANGYVLGQQQMANNTTNATIQGAGQLAGAIGSGLSQSDERIKHDVQRFPVEAAPGVPLASFSYDGQPGKYLGVIAQDLEKTHPEHVSEGPDGTKLVSARFAPFRFK